MNSEAMEGECSSSSAVTNTDMETQSHATVDIQKQAQASSSGVSATETTAKPVQTNLQRIKQQKQDVYNWPRNKKLFKLAMFSSCQVFMHYH